MKIERNGQKVYFREIASGEVFANPSGNLPAMKTDEIVEEGCGVICNAVDLQTGASLYFDNNQEVIPLDAKLVIS